MQPEITIPPASAALIGAADAARHDDFIDRLGTYFVHWQIREKYGITFESFVQMVSRGAWLAWKS